MYECLCRLFISYIVLILAVESFGADFASGYLFGEVLNKFNLQPDFGEFSKLATSDAKLGNWIKLGNTMSAIGVNITPAIV